jgi:hypothetical protein
MPAAPFIAATKFLLVFVCGLESLLPVVIRVHDLGLERLYAIRRFLRRHRERQVHRDESDIDVGERLDLRRALGVPCEQNPLAPSVSRYAFPRPFV